MRRENSCNICAISNLRCHWDGRQALRRSHSRVTFQHLDFQSFIDYTSASRLGFEVFSPRIDRFEQEPPLRLRRGFGRVYVSYRSLEGAERASRHNAAVSHSPSNTQVLASGRSVRASPAPVLPPLLQASGAINGGSSIPARVRHQSKSVDRSGPASATAIVPWPEAVQEEPENSTMLPCRACGPRGGVPSPRSEAASGGRRERRRYRPAGREGKYRKAMAGSAGAKTGYIRPRMLELYSHHTTRPRINGDQ